MPENDGDERAQDAGETRRRIADLEAQLAIARSTITHLHEENARTVRAELLRGELERVRERLGEAYDIEAYARKLYLRDKESRKAIQDELDRTRAELRKLRRRRAVKVAVKVADVARPAYRMGRRVVRRLRGARNRERRAQPHRERTQTSLAHELRSRRARTPRSGPLVSIVILTRDGRDHMERVLTGLRDRTAYRSFEVIVVDNASTDDTPAILARDWGFPLVVIRNEHNATFSAGNNQAVRRAQGELVLFLNNDVDPITPGWLGAMVDTLGGSERRAGVGAILVYPERPGLQRPQHPDLTIQHGGIGFFLPRGAPHARNLGGGSDPLDPAWRETRPVAAATAACLLVKRDRLEAAGGLDEGYVYGTEDVDLCLKLRAGGGEIWLCGDAVLFHHEFGTQSTIASEEIGANRMRNWQLFAERWGPQIWRSVRQDQLEGTGAWLGSTGPRTVAITITDADPSAGWGDWFTAHALGDAFVGLGWNVIYAESQFEDWYALPAGVDVIVVLHDNFDLSRAPVEACSIAWIRNWTDRWIARPWFDRFDLVAGSSEQTADIVRELSLHDPVVLPLAGDPVHFERREPSDDLRCDYTFTGSNWGAGRRLSSWLEIREDEVFGLYGKGWDEDEHMRAHTRGFLDYRRLPELYASTKIVLDDTAEHTLPYAAMNSRVFEALLCGALVITNNVLGSFELFDGLLPTYSSPEELRAQLDLYLSNDHLREATVERLRAIVLERHTFDKRVQQFLDAARAQIQKPRIALKIAASNSKVAKSWGDTHFANDFARALRARGMTVRIDLRDAWDARERQTDDVVVQLRGLHRYRPKPAHLNVMWVISHPEDVDPAECEAFGAVFVASATFAEELRAKQGSPVHVLQQATDPERFRPRDGDPELRSDLLFVGNSRNQFRPVVRWALELGLPLTLYGQMWEQFVPEGTVRAEYFPNERLAELYASAGIVLCDHWDDMVRYGFISNRIFDALSCGAFVISDRVEGIDETFGGAVPTFGSREEFAEVVERFRADPVERARLATRGMELVRKEHSFEARADDFLAVIEPLLRARPRTIEDRGAQ